jgi:hypothetical protein
VSGWCISWYPAGSGTLFAAARAERAHPALQSASASTSNALRIVAAKRQSRVCGGRGRWLMGCGWDPGLMRRGGPLVL